MGANEWFGGRKQPPAVPMNSDQVWMLDAVRAMHGRDLSALVVWWLLGLVFLATAIAGSSTLSFCLSGVIIASAAWWTTNKVRAAREGRSMQRYADSRPEE